MWIGWLAGSHSPQRSRPFPPSHRFSSYSCSLLPSTLVQVASQLVATILLHCRRWVFFLEIFPPPPPSSRRRVCRRYGLKITPNDLICHRVPVPLNVPLWIYYRVIGLSVFGSGNQAKDHAAERCSVLPFFFFAIVTIGGGGGGISRGRCSAVVLICFTCPAIPVATATGIPARQLSFLREVGIYSMGAVESRLPEVTRGCRRRIYLLAG